METCPMRNLPCVFYSNSQCSYPKGQCQPIIDKCNGCDHIIVIGDSKYCSKFPDPELKWRLGRCNGTSLVEQKKTKKKKINPLKASKRRKR